MNRLRLKKNASNKKCALEERVFQTETRADFLERIVRVFRGFTVTHKLHVINFFHMHMHKVFSCL